MAHGCGNLRFDYASTRMIRLLYLMDHPADFQTDRSARALSRDLGDEFQAQTRTIGRRGDDRDWMGALLSLRRHPAGTEIDIIHAWGMKALTAAVLAGAARVVYTPTHFPTRRSIAWLRAMTGYRDVQVICPTSTMRRLYIEAGIPLDRCHLIRPGVEFARINRRRNRALRDSLGLADADYVLLAAGESTPAAAHRQAVWAASILRVLDPRHQLLLWGRGDQIDQLLRFADQLGHEHAVKIAERRLKRRVEFEELLGAADMVLVTADAPAPTLPIAICMAAGLPIVATVTPTTAELLEDRHTALMVSQSSPRAIAQRVLHLQEDHNLQWAISDMARTEAYEYFSLTRFLNQHRAAYRQIMNGQKVEIPEQPPGAGLRFHGRT